MLNLRLLLRLNPRLMPMPGMEAMVAMDLDMEAMEAMEDIGPTTLARGLLMLNLRLLLRLNLRLRPMPGMEAMVATDLDTEAMVDMVWETVPMVDMGAMVDMEVMV